MLYLTLKYYPVEGFYINVYIYIYIKNSFTDVATSCLFNEYNVCSSTH